MSGHHLKLYVNKGIVDKATAATTAVQKRREQTMWRVTHSQAFFVHFKKNSGFWSILVKTQVINRDFRVALLNTPPKKTQVQQQKSQGLDQLLINEYSLGRPKKKPDIVQPQL